MRKIDAPRAWADEDEHGRLLRITDCTKGMYFPIPVRIIREPDYRKITALRKAVEMYRLNECESTLYDLDEAMDALEGKESPDADQEP